LEDFIGNMIQGNELFVLPVYQEQGDSFAGKNVF